MKHKNNILSVFLTTLVIGLLILSGPAQAIKVNISEIEDIDLTVENPQDVEFTIQVQINDGEFLPLSYTDLILDYGDGQEICKINNDNSIDNCDFLTVTSKELDDLYVGYGYGYGYNNGLGGHGTITYTINVDVSKLPVEFLNKKIDVEARVYGGTEDNWRYFEGTSSFNVNAEKEIAIDVTQDQTATYPNVVISIPANSLPDDATKVIISQVAPTANPTNINFNILGKVYDFDVDSTTKTFNGNLQITLTYTDEELGDYNENRIAPAFYNIVTGDWELLTILSRDPDNNKLTFLTNHFTQFALLADTSAVSGGSNGGPSGGGVGSSNRRGPLNLIFPEGDNVSPEEENGEDLSGEEILAQDDSGLGGITGAVTGNIGKSGSVIALIVLAVGAVAFILIRRKK